MPQGSTSTKSLPYKYKDLKIYASTEWLAGNKKKYRQVFEKSDTSYVYAELSFINKQFEGTPWEVQVNLKCSSLNKSKKEICSLDITRQVSKHDHIVHIREGWGQKQKGSFWSKGKYVWEAFIDGKKLASKIFYIEETQKPRSKSNLPGLHIADVNFFEGDYDQNEANDTREYYTQFYDKETRYVYLETKFDNKIQWTHWMAEIFIRFYNSARELKGEVIRLQKIGKDQETFTITAGWGSNVKGSWRKGTYTVEIIHNERLLGTVDFNIGDSFEEGQSSVQYPNDLIEVGGDTITKTLSYKKTFKELNGLVGLHEVKKQIHHHTQYIKYLKLRQERGFEEASNMRLHSVFLGNPGTGKTTIAQMLGSIYHHLGLLTKGHVFEVDRVDLIGEFIGQTAPKVKEVIEKARGGVLLIDEAYALARSKDDSKDFGREAIELLVKEMDKPNCDFFVIAAGYPEEMEVFLNSNPGLSSRFRYRYEFNDYSMEELQRILEKMSDDAEVELTEQARSEMYSLIQKAYRKRDKSFGNARMVGKLLEQAKINAGIRVMSHYSSKTIRDEDLRLITKQDVLKLTKDNREKLVNLKVDEELLASAMVKLDALVGLSEIKNKINDLIRIIRFKTSRDDQVIGSINMHLVLVGNPGTGKTTIARIFADICKALGVLEKGHIIETDRQGLVAGYVGQTAIKTAKVIKEAQGGVLFIDEAYSLNKTGANNDFGDEAIQVLLKKMEDNRGKFFVFVAGYPDMMDSFLNMNPGLKSRFDHVLHFKDFSLDELVEIGKAFCKNLGYKMSSDGVKLLEKQLSKEYATKDKRFGNARRVRKYVDEIVKQQNLRLSQEENNLSPNYESLIKRIDVEQAIDRIDDQYVYSRDKIGF